MDIINALISGGHWNHMAVFFVWDDPGGFYENVWNPDPDFFGHGAMRVPLICIGPYLQTQNEQHENDHLEFRVVCRG